MPNMFAENRELLEHLVTKPVLVDITNVANYVQHLPQDDFDITEEMLYLPWDKCWFEYVTPKTQLFNGKIRKVCNHDIRVGIFAEISEDKDKIFFYIFSDAFVNFDKSLFYVGCSIREIGNPDEAATVVLNPHWAKIQDKASMQMIWDYCASETMNVLYAVLFCHCKNVTYYENEYPTKLQKKRIKRGKIPQETYKVLDIGGLKKQAKSEATKSESELKRALHICRGHFRTYKKENPLFGKVTGTFWCPMHKRGKAEYGKVTKDYKVHTISTP